MKYTHFYEVRDKNDVVRFQSLSRDEAVAHAQSIWRSEKVICEISEVPR